MWFQISLCFQKIAAEILGIKLTKNEMEQQSVSFDNTKVRILDQLQVLKLLIALYQGELSRIGSVREKLNVSFPCHVGLSYGAESLL